VLLALALSGCSGGSGGNGESEQSREAKVLERLAELDTGPKWDTASRDGSLMARLPAGWSEVPDIDPLALLTLSSGPVTGRIISPCLPGAVLDELPTGGALVRVSENFPPARRGGAADRYRPRPSHFRLGRRRPSECGYSYSLGFREGGRELAVWIWTKPAVVDSGSGIQGSRPGRLSPVTRRQLLRLLDGLQVRPAAVDPIRVPTLALDCRNPPNTLDCDRVWVQVNTRIRMKRLSIRVNRWWAGRGDGWVSSGQVMSLPTKLRTAPSGNTPMPVAARSGTVWGGVIQQAGLRGGGAAFERTLPGPGGRWVGTGVGADPRIRADLQVITPRGRWDFRNVELIAGHG